MTSLLLFCTCAQDFPVQGSTFETSVDQEQVVYSILADLLAVLSLELLGV